MIYSRITGTGSHLPGDPVDNNQLVARGIDTSDEWIIERTGIRSRVLSPNTGRAIPRSRAIVVAERSQGGRDR